MGAPSVLIKPLTLAREAAEEAEAAATVVDLARHPSPVLTCRASRMALLNSHMDCRQTFMLSHMDGDTPKQLQQAMVPLPLKV
jgi:hypothetical protein